MSRKLVSDPYLAIHGKKMAKNGHFFMEFWPIFDIFHGLRPYLCSKRQDLGFHKQATHRRCGDEPFFTLGSTVHDWRLPKKGPFESTTHLIHMYYIKINLPFLNNILWRILLLDNTLVLSVISFVKYGSTSFFVHCRHYSAQCALRLIVQNSGHVARRPPHRKKSAK